ncbi:Yip1 member 6 [Gaertneriomyces sp. JEL0708]|nr:Yip1 member 6 [Gaertneriomyces sp. JEL0708]
MSYTPANGDTFEPFDFSTEGGDDPLLKPQTHTSNTVGSAPATIGTTPMASDSRSAPAMGALGSMSGGVLDTLDEPVSQTIIRDLQSIWAKLKQVLVPTKDRKNILRDWDLWGPLLLCLALSIRLSVRAPAGQSPIVFTTVFVIVWCGAAVVTLNSKLLGGKVSFFQSVCVLGYCIFPIVIASIIGLFTPLIVRAVLVSVAFAWSVYASVGFLSDVNLNERRLLAVYPIFLFYFVISWMVLISRSIL